MLRVTNTCSLNFHKMGQRPREVESLAQGHTVRSGAAGETGAVWTQSA